VLDVLSARGHDAVNFDRVESPHHSAGDFETILGEATDVEALAAAFEGCDAVIHLAAMADVNDVQADPEGAELANGRATLAVLEAARRAEVRRVVYGSTIWVYSDCPETEVSEETRLSPPAHLYTATKLAGELYCNSYAELFGVGFTVLRFGIPYGPRARDATVLAAFTKKALRGEPLTVAGSGDQTRRFVYVEDLADGIVRGLDDAAANRVYNLTGSETTTILDIAETVRDLVGDAEIVHTPARAGDFGGKEVSSARARDELGWVPVTPFREGARRYVEWMRAREAYAPALPASPAGAASPVAGALASPAAAASPSPVRAGSLDAASLAVASPDRDAAPLSPALSAAREGRAPRSAVRRRVASVLATVPRPLRAAATSAIVAALFFWGFASDDGLSVIAKAFPGTRPVTGVETSAPTVGLIVDAPASSADDVARALQRDGASATIALTSVAPEATVEGVRAAGSEVMPRLKPGGPVRWIGTRGQLGKTARGLGIHGHFYYAAPGKGFTLAQDLLGHTAGATPVSGAVKLNAGNTLGKLERGDLVEVTIGEGGSWKPWLRSLVEQMRERGLRAVSAADLVRAEPDER
jgi:UDP-glucose 4-epimerase